MIRSNWWNVLLGPVAGGISQFAMCQGETGHGFYLSAPDEEGWTDFDACSPPEGVLLQIRHWNQDGYTYLIPTNAENLSPYLNRHALQWRLTGIGREQFEAMVNS